MPSFKVVYKASEKKAIVLLAADTTPADYVVAGTFIDDTANTIGDNSVAYDDVQEALYAAGVTDMRAISIHMGPQSIEVLPSVAAKTVAQTQQLTATFLPDNAFGANTVNWTTSNAAIATVDASGLVTAVGAGVATITGTCAFGGKTDTCVVTVTV